MTRRPASVRAAVLVTGLASLALIAAGCGGSKALSVASVATTTSAGGASSATGAASAASARPSTAALITCFASHGFQATAGSGGSGNSITFGGVTISGNVDPDSPQFQAATQACSKYLPGGGPPAMTPAQQAAAAKANLSLAECMRKNGVSNFPDPNSQGRFPEGTMKQLDPNSPLFQTAFKTCGPLQSKVGPRIGFG